MTSSSNSIQVLLRWIRSPANSLRSGSFCRGKVAPEILASSIFALHVIRASVRAMGLGGRLVYCSDCRCSHWGRISADQWPDDVRLSNHERLFVCEACGTRPADLRSNFHLEREHRHEKAPSSRRVWTGLSTGQE